MKRKEFLDRKGAEHIVISRPPRNVHFHGLDCPHNRRNVAGLMDYRKRPTTKDKAEVTCAACRVLLGLPRLLKEGKQRQPPPIVEPNPIEAAKLSKIVSVNFRFGSKDVWNLIEVINPATGNSIQYVAQWHDSISDELKAAQHYASKYNYPVTCKVPARVVHEALRLSKS